MNKIENVIIDLLKKDLITTEDVVGILKDLNEISDKTVSFKYDNKRGANVRISLPADIIKTGFNKVFEKAFTLKQEDKKETENDDIVKNILKLIK